MEKRFENIIDKAKKSLIDEIRALVEENGNSFMIGSDVLITSCSNFQDFGVIGDECLRSFFIKEILILEDNRLVIHYIDMENNEEEFVEDIIDFTFDDLSRICGEICIGDC